MTSDSCGEIYDKNGGKWNEEREDWETCCGKKMFEVVYPNPPPPPPHAACYKELGKLCLDNSAKFTYKFKEVARRP
jgi:hypothetical protein